MGEGMGVGVPEEAGVEFQPFWVCVIHFGGIFRPQVEFEHLYDTLVASPGFISFQSCFFCLRLLTHPCLASLCKTPLP